MSQVQYITTVFAKPKSPKLLAGRPRIFHDAAKEEAKEDIASQLGALHTPLPSKFGQFGGQYAPESLMDALAGLEASFLHAVLDEGFWREFRSQYSFMGRPGHLHLAGRLTRHVGGANIWLKREDLNHTGSHTINNVMGQVLLARRLGKTRIITDTGGGQQGIAAASVCARFGMDCTVYMGSEDISQHPLAVRQMGLLGATVISVNTGSKTVRDAVNEALRAFVTSLDTTHYIMGSAVGPHPFPTIARTFQTVIGNETKEQFAVLRSKLPDAVVASIGGGSNAVGMFSPFLHCGSVRLLGVEAAGDGMATPRHGATLAAGSVGVYHGARTYVLQDRNGQIQDAHSATAGLRYPGVNPELASWKESGRMDLVTASDKQALETFRLLSRLEGIIPAMESAHAVYGAMWLAKKLRPGDDVVVCLSGRGDDQCEP